MKTALRAYDQGILGFGRTSNTRVSNRIPILVTTSPAKPEEELADRDIKPEDDWILGNAQFPTADIKKIVTNLTSMSNSSALLPLFHFMPLLFLFLLLHSLNLHLLGCMPIYYYPKNQKIQ